MRFTPDHLDRAASNAVAVAIGAAVEHTPFAESALDGQLFVSESFPVRQVILRETDNHLVGHLHFEGEWCHLLKSGKRYLGFATATPIGPKPEHWMLGDLVWSPLANKMAQSIHWARTK